jgi:hypothetical protein
MDKRNPGGILNRGFPDLGNFHLSAQRQRFISKVWKESSCGLITERATKE